LSHSLKSPKFGNTPTFGISYPQKYPHEELALTMRSWTKKDKSR
jgi:hypothetical protein